MAPTLDELTIADKPSAWRECGFEVDGEVCGLGEVRVRLAGEEAGRGLVGWSLREVAATDLDGLATSRSDSPPPPRPAAHPNGVTALDHVVAISPDLDRTIDALEAAGLDLRRVREEPTPAGAPRQAFFRLGALILEVVQEPDEATERAGGARTARPSSGGSPSSHPTSMRASPGWGATASVRPAMRFSRVAGSRPCAARPASPCRLL